MWKRLSFEGLLAQQAHIMLIMVVCLFFEKSSYSIALIGLELADLSLPLPLRCEPPHPAVIPCRSLPVLFSHAHIAAALLVVGNSLTSVGACEESDCEF